MMKNQVLDTSLKKVAKGTGVVLIGTIVGIILSLASRVIITRYITPSQYGLISLSLVITGITGAIACLGFPQATPRYIAYHKGKKDIGKVWQTIKASLSISFVLSLILFLLVFFFAHTLANLFNKPQLAPVIKIFSFTIPANVVRGILVSIFRGFGEAKPRVYFQNIFPHIAKLSLLGMVIILGWAFWGVVYATIISIILVAVISGIYAVKKIPNFISKQRHIASSEAVSITKEFLFFSLPLFPVVIVNLVISSTDTLMLGYFTTSRIVGLYNVAYSLAHYVVFILAAMGFIYSPIATTLYSGNLLQEMGKIYKITTKWVFSVTLPVFFLVFLAPQSTLYVLFGPNYVAASTAVRILAVGFFIHTILGSNGVTLLVLGKTKLIMMNSLIVVGLNVFLNWQLIPRFGLEGAAFASTSSLFARNILVSTEVYKVSGIHPFTKKYFKQIITSCIMATAYYSIVEKLIVNVYLKVLLFTGGFAVISLVSIILSRSVEREDLMMLKAIQQKLEINFPLAERTFKRLIK